MKWLARPIHERCTAWKDQVPQLSVKLAYGDRPLALTGSLNKPPARPRLKWNATIRAAVAFIPRMDCLQGQIPSFPFHPVSKQQFLDLFQLLRQLLPLLSAFNYLPQ